MKTRSLAKLIDKTKPENLAWHRAIITKLMSPQASPLTVNEQVYVALTLEDRKRPTNPALAVHCRAWEVCSVIGKLVSTHDDGYGFGWPGAPAAMDDL
jgi:hypothetical protein